MAVKKKLTFCVSNSIEQHQKMACLTKVLLLLSLVLCVKGEVFNKKFLVRMEDITNTNRECNQAVADQRQIIDNFNLVERMEDVTETNMECNKTVLEQKQVIGNLNLVERMEEVTETNRECNKTVIEQKQMMANLNSTVENLKTTIQNLNSTLESLKAADADKDAIIENLRATIESLNATLSMIQKMQNGELHNFICGLIYFETFLIKSVEKLFKFHISFPLVGTWET